jgi:hypothetical protein
MIIPMMAAPYAIFLPAAYLGGDYAGLIALGVVGLLGMIAYPKLSDISVQKVLNNRYEISSSFRQEL